MRIEYLLNEGRIKLRVAFEETRFIVAEIWTRPEDDPVFPVEPVIQIKQHALLKDLVKTLSKAGTFPYPSKEKEVPF